MGHVQGCSPYGLTTDANYDQSITVSEVDAREISRSVTVLVSKGGGYSLVGDSIDHLKILLEDLLRTASSPQLSASHGAAVLSALCGLLDQCSISHEPQIQTIAVSPETWRRAFQIMLERCDINKAKPIRKLLMTLTSLLTKQPIEDVRATLVKEACVGSFNAVFSQGHTASLKLAVQLLEHFLRKHIVTPSSILKLAASVRESGFSDEGVAATPGIVAAAQSLMLTMLNRLEHPDCVPAISRFLAVLVITLREEGSVISDASQNQEHEYSCPIWIDPVKLYHERSPSNWDKLEHHVLPHLLRISQRDFNAFLDSLPLDKIQQDRSGSCSEAELQLCLLTARIGIRTKLGEIVSIGESSSALIAMNCRR